MSIEEDDPFAVFGDDDDDDEEDIQDTEASRIASSLVDLANRRIQGEQQVEEGENNTRDAEPVASSPDVCLMEAVAFPWPEPLYISPMMFVASLPFGGGRGCAPKRDLQPGTLVLVEEPIASWPDSIQEPGLNLIQSLEHILQLPEASKILHCMECLHPTKQVVDAQEDDSVSEMMVQTKEQHANNGKFEDCVAYAAQNGLVNGDGSPISQQDLLRLLLALRYNGLESGVFLYSAMLNHADQPNCVKFQPQPPEKRYSEVRTTRFVRAGEPLTISYLPNLVSHASRRKYLWEQHRFDIGADLAPGLREMETIGGQLPVSNPDCYDSESATCRIEKTISELEDVLRITKSNAQQTLFGDSAVSEQVQALEQATLELCSEAERQLRNEKHLLLIPCRRLHMESCDLAQQDPSLTALQRTQLVGRFLISAQKLLDLQRLFHGSDHFDLARTCNDLSQAIGELLTKSPKHLVNLGATGMSRSISAWSSLEHTYRKEYNRIKALYPHDVENFTNGKTE